MLGHRRASATTQTAPRRPNRLGRGGLRPLAALDLLHDVTASRSSAAPCQRPQIPTRSLTRVSTRAVPKKALFSSPVGWAALDVLLFGNARPGQGPAASTQSSMGRPWMTAVAAGPQPLNATSAGLRLHWREPKEMVADTVGPSGNEAGVSQVSETCGADPVAQVRVSRVPGTLRSVAARPRRRGAAAGHGGCLNPSGSSSLIRARSSISTTRARSPFSGRSTARSSCPRRYAPNWRSAKSEGTTLRMCRLSSGFSLSISRNPGAVAGNIAREVQHLVPEWQGRVWARRYRHSR
jgi:hypothetical protein